jgi:hypothetical protein
VETNIQEVTKLDQISNLTFKLIFSLNSFLLSKHSILGSFQVALVLVDPQLNVGHESINALNAQKGD